MLAIAYRECGQAPAHRSARAEALRWLDGVPPADRASCQSDVALLDR